MRRLSTLIAIAAAAAAVLTSPAPALAGVTGIEGSYAVNSVSVTDITTTTALIHAEVTGTSAQTWHLAWSEDESYSSEVMGDITAAPFTFAPSMPVTDLKPGTLYHVRAGDGMLEGELLLIIDPDTGETVLFQPQHSHTYRTTTFTTLAESVVPPVTPPVGPPVDPNVCHNPSITGAEPIAVMAGERIVFTGTGFGTGGVLRFSDAVATTIESWTPTVIAARVPAGAGPDVSVTCADGTSSRIRITIITTANQPPVAVVDNLGSAAKPALDSSGSFDVDGAVIKRAWTSGKRKLSTKLVYRPKLKPGQRMKVTLTVWDAKGASDHVSVAVKAPTLKAKARKPITEKVTVALNAQVLFGFDRATLSAAGKKAIARLRTLARTSTRISIAGFASQEGPADYNLALSRDRATSVKTALKSRAKVTVTANGEGGKPRVKETGPRSRQMNRKVIITMTRKG